MQTSRVSAVAALGARTRALGRNNALLWHLPADLKRFKEITSGHPVVMGRKTWESIPERFRPLPGRTNIVVTRNADYAAPGALVCTSLDDALNAAAVAPGGEEICLIGGGALYAEALPQTDRLYLTLVDDDAEGDTFFPEYPEFTKVIEDMPLDDNPPSRFVTLERP